MKGAEGAGNDAFDDLGAGSAVETATAPEVTRRPRRARRYQVVVHNDDYTTMEFVVAMLMKHFHKPPAEAMHIMLLVHHKGAGIAGVYPRDVAETKVAEAMDEARQEGMPLLLTVEPHVSEDPGDAGGSAGPAGSAGSDDPEGSAGPAAGPSGSHRAGGWR